MKFILLFDMCWYLKGKVNSKRMLKNIFVNIDQPIITPDPLSKGLVFFFDYTPKAFAET